MAITYPLNTPTNIGIANITLSAENAVAISQSPFTFQQQIVAHPGQRWAASVSLPPMKRQDAEYWIAFLLSLKGQIGTFLLGDPNCVDAQGSATTKRNLLTFTEQFDNARWVKTANGTGSAPVVTPNAATAPDGTTTADQVVFNTNAGTASTDWSMLNQTVTVSAVNHTGSIYIRTLSGTATLVFRNAAAAGFGAISVTNQWQRFERTELGLAGTGNRFEIGIRQGLAGIGTINASATVLIWGAQLEVGSAPTAYQGVVDAYGPFVNGGSQIGDSLVIDGCSPNVTGFLLPGDYIQLGSGAATQLYKVLTQVDTDGSGNATLDIWPNLRSSPADNATVVVANTKGRFRLKDNIQQWQINEISSYGITFDCVEAI